MSLLSEIYEGKVWRYDCAVGTNLPRHESLPCDLLNETNPQLVSTLHRSAVEAGAQVVKTNTFQCNMYNFDHHAAHKLNALAVMYAKHEVRTEGAYVAGCIGPPPPAKIRMRNIEDDVTYHYAPQIQSLTEAGVDMFLVESQTLTFVARRIVQLCKAAAPAVPVHLSFALDSAGSTYGPTSAPAASVFEFMHDSPAEVIGFNCLPWDSLDQVTGFADHATKPYALMPNAPSELPDMNPVARCLLEARRVGVKLVGGCCGTTPELISILRDS